MVDFDFYHNSYLGSAITEKQFPECAQKAKEALERLKRRYRVESTGAESEKMALCAMAEAIASAARRKDIRSATVGNVSVHYEGDSAASLQRQLYRCAGIYLDIYRGAGSL